MHKKSSHTNNSHKKPSHTSNMHKKSPHTNSSHKKPRTNNMHKKPSHTNNLYERPPHKNHRILTICLKKHYTNIMRINIFVVNNQISTKQKYTINACIP